MIAVKCTKIQLPGLGSAGGFSGKKKETLYYSFTNYTTPGTIPAEAKKGKSAVYQNQKWTLKVKILNPNKFFILQRRTNPNDDYL
jgi:prolyl oligopeptidase